MSSKKKRKILKVGLLLNSYNIPLWEFLIIKKLISSHYASIDLVVLNESYRLKNSFLKKVIGNWKFVIFHLYNLIDQYFFKVERNAFEIKDVSLALGEINTITLSPYTNSDSNYLKFEDIEKIKNHNLDVLLKLGSGVIKGDILSASHFGVWSYCYGHSSINNGEPAGFWEVFENNDVTGSTLQILSNDSDKGRILFKSFSATNKVSVHRNRNNSYWKSLSFLPRKLESLYNLGGEEFLRSVDQLNRHPIVYSNKLYGMHDATNWKMLKLLVKLFFRLLGSRFSRLFLSGKWSLFFAFGEGMSFSFRKFKVITPPKDRFFADPFVVFDSNKYFIFIEEFIAKFNKGRISVIEMDENGIYQIKDQGFKCHQLKESLSKMEGVHGSELNVPLSAQSYNSLQQQFKKE